MRNLVVLHHSHDPILPSSSSPFTHFTYDYTSKHLYACTASNLLVKYEKEGKRVVHEVSLSGEGVLSDGASIVDLQCIHNMGLVCAVSDKGDIIVYETETKQVF